VDENTFNAIFKEHRDAVYRYAHVLTRSTAAAEDIAQECFLSITNYDSTRGPVRAYLLGAVRRQAFKRFRNLARESEEADATSQPADTASEVAVREAVESLPALQREAILLFHWEGYTLEEIAGMLDTEIGTVKARLSRARENLRRTLAPLGRSNGTSSR
jgi:RNA polymerase sigma-70 factor (ECF subfamily)